MNRFSLFEVLIVLYQCAKVMLDLESGLECFDIVLLGFDRTEMDA